VHPTAHLLCTAMSCSAPQKAGSPVPQRCHADNHPRVLRSSPTPHSKGRVELPDIMDIQHLTEQHLISSSNIRASDTKKQQDWHLTDKQVQFQALPTNIELAPKSALAGFIYTQKKTF